MENRIGKDDSPHCSHYEEGEEIEDQLVFVYRKWKDFRREVWIDCKEEAGSRSSSSWEDIDKRIERGIGFGMIFSGSLIGNTSLDSEDLFKHGVSGVTLWWGWGRREKIFRICLRVCLRVC